jgi:putative ubiquitin-RnfH superfamily antitoxin RatB of RatAB toxin-antitoxin module
MSKLSVSNRVFWVLLLSAVVFGFTSVWAATDFVLSTHPDFSTDDRIFTRDDTMYMKVTVPGIDFTEIHDNEFRLHAGSGGGDFEGRFTNHLDGTFTARLSLKNADANESNWEWRGRIRDRRDREFEAEVNLQIVGSVNGDIEVTLKGKIESLGAAFVVVQNTNVSINASTQIFDERGQLLTFADLRVGQSVRVSAVRDAGGNLVARRIKFVSRSENELELKGKIESIGESSLVVMGLSFNVDTNTEIENHDHDPISLSDLSVGQLVEIKARVQNDGSRLALRIRIEDHSGNEMELRGKIESLGDSTLTVSGVAFAVSASTVILGDENQSISFADLQVSQLVEVKGILTQEELVMAVRIKVEGRLFGDDELEFTGLVSEIGANFIVVSGFHFEVTAATVILDNNNLAITLAEVRTGLFVEIRADVAADGSLKATHIKIEDRFDDEVEFTGEITNIGENALTVGEKVFVINGSTMIFDNNNQPISFGALKVGMIVEIRGDVQFDGSLLATHIKIEDRGDDEVELTGRIDAISGETLVLGGFTFTVNANTIVLDNNNNAISFAALYVGLIVEIRADKQLDGTLLATNIKIEDRMADEVEITGLIEALTETSITVAGQTFSLTANTIFWNSNNLPVDRATLSVGQRVEIKGDLLADGTLIALRVKLEDGVNSEVEVEGPVSQLGLGTIVVLQNEFIVNLGTLILDVNSLPITLGDLLVGQIVKVRGLLELNGARIATQIQLRNVVVVSGPVAQVNANSIVILNKVVNVDVNTLIFGSQNRAIAFADLKAGDRVEVRGEPQPNNEVSATKIKSQESNIVTSIGGETGPGGSFPVAFSLEQNYPNPFNPSTSINYNLARDGRVRLTVYNLLGQQVATLVDEVRSAGSHTLNWNAASMPSGIYIYRLEADAQVFSRRMTLMK